MKNHYYQVHQRGPHNRDFAKLGKPVYAPSPFIAIERVVGHAVTYSHTVHDDQYFTEIRDQDHLYTVDEVDDEMIPVNENKKVLR